MELKQFVKNVLKDLVEAVEESRRESSRDLHLTSHKETNQAIEFDIAVSAEDAIKTGGKAGVRVFQFIEGGGDMSKEVKNSTVSRIKFGIYIDTLTKQESAQRRARLDGYYNNHNNNVV